MFENNIFYALKKILCFMRNLVSSFCLRTVSNNINFVVLIFKRKVATYYFNACSFFKCLTFFASDVLVKFCVKGYKL